MVRTESPVCRLDSSFKGVSRCGELSVVWWISGVVTIVAALVKVVVGATSATLGQGPVTSGDGTGARGCVATVSISSCRRSGATSSAMCVGYKAPERMPTGRNPSEDPDMLPVDADGAGNARVGCGPSSVALGELTIDWAAEGTEVGQISLL